MIGMRTVRGFLRLTSAERRLAARCWYLLVRSALVTRVQPVRRIVTAIDLRTPALAACPPVAPDSAIRLLEAAARRVWPRPACLARALAGYELLRERGVEVDGVIGGRRVGQGFEAHAWLEQDGQVVLGGPVSAYRPLWRWPG